MSFFFFYKIGEQENETGLPLGEGARRWGEQGRVRKRVWEGEYSANSVYTCM
jgi:hypothetical protein